MSHTEEGEKLQVMDQAFLVSGKLHGSDRAYEGPCMLPSKPSSFQCMQASKVCFGAPRPCAVYI